MMAADITHQKPGGSIQLDSSHLPALEPSLPKPIEQPLYLINGELKRWFGLTEAVHPVILGEQGSSEILGFQPMLDEVTALAAGSAAKEAWKGGLGSWPNATAEERIAAAETFLDQLELRRDRIVDLLMWEIGKSRALATSELDRTIDFIHEAINTYRIYEKGWQHTETRQGVTTAQGLMPLGTVLCMGPSNYPLNESLTTAIPAALIGNSVIIKTPRYGVLVFNAVMEALAASFPSGVINVIGGDGRTVVPPLMRSGIVDGLAFIGTERAASAILEAHPRRDRITRLLGLSAKNPAVVMADADLDQAVSECIKGALSFNGQRCTALKIIYVDRSIAANFAQKLAAEVEHLAAGMPWQDGVELTPLYEAGKSTWLNELVADAKRKGAQVLNLHGGETLSQIYTPAVLFPVDSNMRIAHEEQFGPLVPIVPFDSLESVLNEIATSPYGQQVSLFTQQADGVERARLINKLLLVGGSRLNLNTQSMRGPDDVIFGGRRDAGIGYVSIDQSLTTFSVRSVIAQKI